MTEQEVIDLVADALAIERGALSRDSEAKDYEQWDSMGLLVLVALLDRQGVHVDPGDAQSLQTMQGVIAAFRQGGRME